MEQLLLMAYVYVAIPSMQKTALLNRVDTSLSFPDDV